MISYVKLGKVSIAVKTFFLVWRLRIGACGVGAYDSYPFGSTLEFQSKNLFRRISESVCYPVKIH